MGQNMVDVCKRKVDSGLLYPAVSSHLLRWFLLLLPYTGERHSCNGFPVYHESNTSINHLTCHRCCWYTPAYGPWSDSHRCGAHPIDNSRAGMLQSPVDYQTVRLPVCGAKDLGL